MSDEDKAKRHTNFSLGKIKLNFELIGIEGRLSEKMKQFRISGIRLHLCL